MRPDASEIWWRRTWLSATVVSGTNSIENPMPCTIIAEVIPPTLVPSVKLAICHEPSATAMTPSATITRGETWL